ncbi:PREDICTED: uncharacterized protein C14orf105 homolog isoform X1 [Gavialis gangeticus]|uniref:uncharacterized protein C14orf105 homolog isoform X1 n=1 Tax=Gavialis gangeticus TaxID=94835 RepID=UPI00092E92C1|nr:PREDICTED: uncharacterized protein C14orf105 homolog isoform X1 [Gavialis gangeticus]
MGLSHSKTRPKVTKVAPVQTKEAVPASPCSATLSRFHGVLEERSLGSFAAMEERSPMLQRQLPPLRETWYGRCSTVPRPIAFDIMPEKGETSIIKQHPPRRPQKLEPIDLPPVITSEARWRPQEQEAAQKAKNWEKRVQAVTHSTGRRQHLHKLQMLELNRKRQEAEMKRGHHREAKLKQKPEELKPEKVHGRIWRNNSSDSEDRVPVEPALPYTKDHRTTWDGEFLEQCQMFESHPRQSSKVEMWSLKQQAAKELFWDSSSTDSEDWKNGERKLYHRPGLVRTKTERISLFDEFFDKHF